MKIKTILKLVGYQKVTKIAYHKHNHVRLAILEPTPNKTPKD